MAQEPETQNPHIDYADAPNLPEMRADHIPDDVLAEQDAETRLPSPEIDPLVHLSGAPDDLLTEEDEESRMAEHQSLTPTDDEVLDLAQDN